MGFPQSSEMGNDFFSQDFRLTAYHSYPWALEMYYKMGEAIEPENKIREFDLMVWQREGRLEMK